MPAALPDISREAAAALHRRCCPGRLERTCVLCWRAIKQDLRHNTGQSRLTAQSYLIPDQREATGQTGRPQLEPNIRRGWGEEEKRRRGTDRFQNGHFQTKNLFIFPSLHLVLCAFVCVRFLSLLCIALLMLFLSTHTGSYLLVWYIIHNFRTHCTQSHAFIIPQYFSIYMVCVHFYKQSLNMLMHLFKPLCLCVRHHGLVVWRTLTLSFPCFSSWYILHRSPSLLYATLYEPTNCTWPKSLAPWVMTPVTLVGTSKSTCERQREKAGWEISLVEILSAWKGFGNAILSTFSSASHFFFLPLEVIRGFTV